MAAAAPALTASLLPCAEASAAALDAAIKSLTPVGGDALQKRHETQLELTTPQSSHFDVVDFVGSFVLTLVNGVGWVPTVMIPNDADTLKCLVDGEGQRGGCSKCTKTHSYSCGGGMYTCPHGHAHAAPKPKPMAEAEEAAAAQAAARSGTKKRGPAQLHTTIKGAPLCAVNRAHAAPRAARRARAPRAARRAPRAARLLTACTCRPAPLRRRVLGALLRARDGRGQHCARLCL